jgi:hypothetical protein
LRTKKLWVAEVIIRDGHNKELFISMPIETEKV